ncbi:MAG: hypothetical protein V1685_04880 [Parcubacteria group bacterium]
MRSKSVTKFVKQLAAAYPRFPMTPDTQELYGDKLSGWKLTEKQWDRALEVIVQGREGQGDIPSLSDVYGYLRPILNEKQAISDAGWCSFDHDGVRWAKRVYSEGGVWKSIQVVFDSVDKRRWHLERTGNEFHPPAGATVIRFKPDLEDRDHIDDHRDDLEGIVEAIPF